MGFERRWEVLLAQVLRGRREWGCCSCTYPVPLLQVEIEVEQSDKGGNFIGWLHFEGKNLSVALVLEGLSKVLPQAERSVHAKELFDSEEKARVARKKIWKVGRKWSHLSVS